MREPLFTAFIHNTLQVHSLKNSFFDPNRFGCESVIDTLFFFKVKNLAGYPDLMLHFRPYHSLSALSKQHCGKRCSYCR